MELWMVIKTTLSHVRCDECTKSKCLLNYVHVCLGNVLSIFVNLTTLNPSGFHWDLELLDLELLEWTEHSTVLTVESK